MQRVGDYTILGELARGGMGAVYRARDPQGKTVALKVELNATERSRRRFMREMRVLQRLRHPNLVPVLAAGEHKGVPYLVMELVFGENLEDVIARGCLPEERALEIAREVADGLAHAHAEGVIHRDVKPPNVLLGAGGEVRLTDFGLAKDLSDSRSVEALTRDGSFLGSPGFLAPEQAKGQLEDLGPAADIYSLGATLYAALTGVPPFEGASLIEVLAAMQGPAPDPRLLRPHLTPAVAELCIRCLALDPLERPDSAHELRAALDDCLLEVQRKRARRSWLLPASLAVGVTFAAGAGVSWLLARTEREGQGDIAASPAPSATLGELEVVRARALALQKRGEFGKALALRLELVERWPEDPLLWTELALVHEALKDDAAALVAYSRALVLSPGFVAALHNRAVLRQRRGEDALEDFAAVVNAKPDFGHAWAGLSAELVRLKETKAALQAINNALRFCPNVARYYSSRAAIYLDLDELAPARADLARALDLDPNNAIANYRMGLLVEDEGGDPAEAEAHYTKTISINAQHYGARFNRGLLRAARKDHKGAIVDYDAAIAIRPKDVVAWVNRASVRRASGDLPGAIADFQAGTKVDASYANGWIGLGLAAAAAKDWALAESAFTTALKLSPDHPSLLLNRGIARNHLGQRMSALDDLQRIVDTQPPDHRLRKRAHRLLDDWK